MYTKSINGDQVRDYFIQIENFLERNKFTIIKDMNQALKKAGIRVKQLELNQKPKIKYPDGGYVYIFRSYTYDQQEIYKIGMSSYLISEKINLNKKDFIKKSKFKSDQLRAICHP